MSGQRRQSDNNTAAEEDNPVVSASPSILRNQPGSRLFPSEAPSVVISLPDLREENFQSPEQRHRRRLRFLEMRREHYSQMHQHTEQCTMSEGEEQQQQEMPQTSTPEGEDRNKSK